MNFIPGYFYKLVDFLDYKHRYELIIEYIGMKDTTRAFHGNDSLPHFRVLSIKGPCPNHIHIGFVGFADDRDIDKIEFYDKPISSFDDLVI